MTFKNNKKCYSNLVISFKIVTKRDNLNDLSTSQTTSKPKRQSKRNKGWEANKKIPN